MYKPYDPSNIAKILPCACGKMPECRMQTISKYVLRCVDCDKYVIELHENDPYFIDRWNIIALKRKKKIMSQQK